MNSFEGPCKRYSIIAVFYSEFGLKSGLEIHQQLRLSIAGISICIRYCIFNAVKANKVGGWRI